MKSSLRRRLAAAALVLTAPFVAACTGTGFNPQTDQVYQPAVGVNDHSGNVSILNAVIVSDDGENGTLSVSLLNGGDETDALQRVVGERVRTEFRPIRLPVNELVNLSEDGEISVTGQLGLGEFVEVEFVFRNGDAATVSVPVVAADAEFAEVPLPSESPSPSDSEAPSAAESESPADAESPTASPTE